MDAFENGIEEIALDIGIVFDKLTGNGGIDLLYMTSITFLIIITVSIIGVLFSYKKSKCHNTSSNSRSTDLAEIEICTEIVSAGLNLKSAVLFFAC